MRWRYARPEAQPQTRRTSDHRSKASSHLPIAMLGCDRPPDSVRPYIITIAYSSKASAVGGGFRMVPMAAIYFAAGSPLAYLRRKRSTRPAVSTSFCLPVKNGWQLEQISTWMSPLWVERVAKLAPQAQTTRISL